MRKILTILSLLFAVGVLTAQIQIPPAVGGAPVGVSSVNSTLPFLALGSPTSATGVLRIPNGNAQFTARNAANSADLNMVNLSAGDVVRIGGAGVASISFQAAPLNLTAVAFASLGTPADGTIQFCSDCTIASPCAGSGTGALAKRLNGIWVCN